MAHITLVHKQSLIARQWVALQTLWRFRLKDLTIDKMVGPDALAVVRPTLFTCWISFAPVFIFMYCWVLIIFALSPFYILIYMYFGDDALIS